MSRIGKKVVQIPDKVKLTYKDRTLTVEGAKGKLTKGIHSAVEIDVDDKSLSVRLLKDDRISRAFQGLTRALIANMVTGVSAGFERSLEINGIGYRAEVQGKTIVLNLGYSHPIHYELSNGIVAVVEKNILKLSGCDKELLGHTAASIRRFRPPEPYKGKGIKYVEEYIQKKAGKTGTK